jgi:hypothetical protein
MGSFRVNKKYFVGPDGMHQQYLLPVQSVVVCLNFIRKLMYAAAGEQYQ